MRGCVICGEELTIDEWKHFSGGLGTKEPWCAPCIEEENFRMVDEEQIGYCLYRTLPKYLIPKDEWEI